MSQPTHLTLALGRARSQKRQNTDAMDLSLTVTYRLDPGEADLGAVVEARADELRGAFAALCARLRPLPAPRPDADADPDEGALDDWRDEDAPEEDQDDDPDALADDEDPDEDVPADRPPTFSDNSTPTPSANGHGAGAPDNPNPEPAPHTEPSSRVQQIAARSAAWRAGLAADDLTLLLAQHFGKVRVEQLDKAEAETFLRALQREEVAARTVARH